MSEYLLEVHGLPQGRKVDGVTRLIYENLNGLQSIRLSKNGKLKKVWRVIDDLQVDTACYNEHQQNLQDFGKSSTMARQSCGQLHPITGMKMGGNFKREVQQ